MLSAQTSRQLQTLLTLLILSALLYLGSALGAFLAQFLGIFLLFFLAWLLADLLRPALRWLTRRGLPTGLAVLVIYLLGPVVVVVAGSLFLPTLNQQAGQLRTRLDTYTA